MVQREKIKDWTGRIIGFVDTDSMNGNKTLRDFYGKILGYYIKNLDITTDFYKRRVAKGDQLLMLLNPIKK